MRWAPLLLAAVSLAIPAAASAQGAIGVSTTAQPRRWIVHAQPFVVTGWRSARFGMTEAQVRDAIAKDFPRAAIVEKLDPVPRTPTLQVRLDALAPGPGAAHVTYLFGASSHLLFRVNVDWDETQPTAQDRVALTQAASDVTADYVGWEWKLLSDARGVVVGPSELVLFTGRDEAGDAVEIRLSGVAYEIRTPAGAQAIPAPAGPARLRLAFQKAGPADVYRIKDGDF